MANEQESAVRQFPEDSRKTLWQGKMSLKDEIAKKAKVEIEVKIDIKLAFKDKHFSQN